MIERKNSSYDLRKIPSVDEIIDHFHGSMVNAPYALYVKIIRQTLDEIRKEICQETFSYDIREYTLNRLENVLGQLSTSNLQSVINGTGIILHTGLGRAPISQKLMKNAMEKVFPYTNIDLNRDHTDWLRNPRQV